MSSSPPRDVKSPKILQPFMYEPFFQHDSASPYLMRIDHLGSEKMHSNELWVIWRQFEKDVNTMLLC